MTAEDRALIRVDLALRLLALIPPDSIPKEEP